MVIQPTATVRLFGVLHALMTERGRPTTIDVSLGDGDLTARDIAIALDLPLELIEGVFVNHTVFDLGHVICPGDRVAFVPHGTPGPHRIALGLYAAGRASCPK